jgi:hypothetical protein
LSLRRHKSGCIFVLSTGVKATRLETGSKIKSTANELSRYSKPLFS